ncbi:MAG TPA: VOC family protein [Chitinophagaceae bacterium]|nr:VOC family protein [Chitinophagaceae bacterium]
MPTIVHFDIGVNNPERAKNFYEALFGWKIGPIAGFPDYYEIETTDINGVKGVGGGLTKRDNPQQNGITDFIGVVSIDETVAKIISLGGNVIQPKQSIPGYGYIAVCADTDKNIFGLFQDDKKAL